MKRIAVTTLVSACFALGVACDSGNEEADTKPGVAASAKADANKDGEANKDKKPKPEIAAAKEEAAKKAPDAAAGGAPTHVAFVTHAVADYDAFKASYDGAADMRKKAAGEMASYVFRDTTDPNKVSVAVLGTDPAKFSAFFGSEELKAKMAEAGVQGAPEIGIYELKGDTRAPEGTTVANTIFVMHEVADYAAWRTGFDADAEGRSAAAIVGWGVGVDVSNPNRVVVRVDSTDLEKTMAMMGTEEMKKKMADAGVKGEPKVSVTTLAWGSDQPGAGAIKAKADSGAPAAEPAAADKKAG